MIKILRPNSQSWIHKDCWLSDEWMRIYSQNEKKYNIVIYCEAEEEVLSLWSVSLTESLNCFIVRRMFFLSFVRRSKNLSCCSRWWKIKFVVKERGREKRRLVCLSQSKGVPLFISQHQELDDPVCKRKETPLLIREEFLFQLTQLYFDWSLLLSLKLNFARIEDRISITTLKREGAKPW